MAGAAVFTDGTLPSALVSTGPVPTGAVPTGSGAAGATLYERVGGDAWFRALVDHFYDGVSADPVLRPLYPDDLGPPREHLTGFLIQYFGGPTTYSQQRGHPRLRMRHAPFAIGDPERESWYRHMAEAARAGELSAADEADVLGYFERAAAHLVNRPS